MSSPFNMTVDDTSPMFRWQPWGEGGLADGSIGAGWATYYDQTGFRPGSGQLPRGDSGGGNSYHVTAFDGSSASLTFRGNAVYIFGVANCTYDVALDSNVMPMNVVRSTVGDVLASFTGLQNTDHTITITPHPSRPDERIAIDKAVVTTLSPTTNIVPLSVSNQAVSQISYSPDAAWTSTSDHGVPSPFEQTNVYEAAASFNFTGHAVAVYGSLNWGHDRYNITLDGYSAQYNGSLYWKVGETLLYFQSGLQVSQNHSIQLLNAINGATTTLTHIDVWIQQNATTPAPQKSSPPVGGIAGGIVAAILVLLGILGFLWYRRRKARQAATGHSVDLSASNSLSQIDPFTAEVNQGFVITSSNPQFEHHATVQRDPGSFHLALPHVSPINSSQSEMFPTTLDSKARTPMSSHADLLSPAVPSPSPPSLPSHTTSDARSTTLPPGARPPIQVHNQTDPQGNVNDIVLRRIADMVVHSIYQPREAGEQPPEYNPARTQGHL